jgi:TRAP-type C4-dicarboxylate transport system substrate-binding protein
LNCTVSKPVFYLDTCSFCLSKIQLEELPQDLQQLVLDAAHEVTDETSKTQAQKDNVAAHEALLAAGQTFTEMDPAEIAKMKVLYEPVFEEWAPKIGDDLIAEVEKVR